MTQTFLAFWIPNLETQIDFKNPLKHYVNFKISEDASEEDIKFRLELSEDLTEVKLYSIKYDTSQLLQTLKIQQVNNRKAIIVFRLDLNSSDSDLIKAYNFWTRGFYNAFKELYHKHSFHSENEDAILEGVMYQDKETIMEFLFKTIKEIFSKKLITEYNLCIQRTNSILKRKATFAELLQVYAMNINYINRTLGEFVYFKHFLKQWFGFENEKELSKLLNEYSSLIEGLEKMRDLYQSSINEYLLEKEMYLFNSKIS